MTFNHLKNKNINFTYHSSHSVCDIYHNIINICLLLIKFWTHFNIFTTIIISIFLSSPITIHFIIFHHNNSGCMNTLQHAIYMYNYTLYSFPIKKCGPRRSRLDIIIFARVVQMENEPQFYFHLQIKSYAKWEQNCLNT